VEAKQHKSNPEGCALVKLMKNGTTVNSKRNSPARRDMSQEIKDFLFEVSGQSKLGRELTIAAGYTF